MDDFVYAWRLDEDSELTQFLRAGAGPQSALLHQAQLGLAARCMFSIIISYADYISDFMLASYYFSSEKYLYAGLTLMWPTLVLVGHTYLTYTDQDRGRVLIASLFGCRPIIDTYRFITNAPGEIDQLEPVLSMSIGRGIELTFESIPQTCMQMFLILRSYVENTKISSIQYFSVFSSMIAAGFIAAMIDYDVDVNQTYRKVEPSLYGFGFQIQRQSACYFFCYILPTWLAIRACESLQQQALYLLRQKF